MQTRTNLVCYKGHNYPIWDIDYSPLGTSEMPLNEFFVIFVLGYYFATASHDRTARLWSTDHIHPLRIFAGHLSDVNVRFDCIRFLTF